MTETLNTNQFSQRMFEDKFAIAADGDDARLIASSDDYEIMSAHARELSEDTETHWLGIKMMGPSGRIRAWYGGREIGYLSDGRWVKVDR